MSVDLSSSPAILRVITSLIIASGLTAALGCGEAPRANSPTSAASATTAEPEAASPFTGIEDVQTEAPLPEPKLPEWVVRSIQPEHFMVAVLRSGEVRARLKTAGLWESVRRESGAGSAPANTTNPVALLKDEAVEAYAAIWAADSLILLTRYAAPIAPAAARAEYAKALGGEELVGAQKFHSTEIWRPKADIGENADNCQALLDDRTLAAGDEFGLRKTIAWWTGTGGARLPLAVATASLAGDEILSVAALRRPADAVIDGLAKRSPDFAEAMQPAIAAAPSIESATLGVRDLPLSATLSIQAINAAGAARIEATAGDYVLRAKEAAASLGAPQPSESAESVQRRFAPLMKELAEKLTVERHDARIVVRTGVAQSIVELGEAANPKPESAAPPASSN